MRRLVLATSIVVIGSAALLVVAPRSMAAEGEGKVTVVTMTDEDAFKPETVTISVGETVRWENKGKKDAHNVTDDPKAASDAKEVAMPAGASAFDSGEIKPGGSFEQRFTVAGTYKYVCKPHEEMGMKGEVIVK
jgi:plastocyanin